MISCFLIPFYFCISSRRAQQIENHPNNSLTLLAITKSAELPYFIVSVHIAQIQQLGLYYFCCLSVIITVFVSLGRRCLNNRFAPQTLRCYFLHLSFFRLIQIKLFFLRASVISMARFAIPTSILYGTARYRHFALRILPALAISACQTSLQMTCMFNRRASNEYEPDSAYREDASPKLTLLQALPFGSFLFPARTISRSRNETSRCMQTNVIYMEILGFVTIRNSILVTVIIFITFNARSSFLFFPYKWHCKSFRNLSDDNILAFFSTLH